MTDVDPKLARSTVSVLNVLIEIEPEHRARVLDAVTKLVSLTSPTPLRLAEPRTKRPKCSICHRVGHNSRGCSQQRRCSRCNKAGHDRRNCPDVETLP